MIYPPVTVSDHVFLLPGFADSALLMPAIDDVRQRCALRHMTVPGGKTMSVAMTNCGELGWVSDSTGYRYSHIDPLSAKPWPSMPDPFRVVAQAAAKAAGFAKYRPDACLINCYQNKARLSVHRDIDEQDFSQPIVSVSLGANARFSVGGLRRHDAKVSVLLRDGDVLVWGGPARRIYHGVGSPHQGTAPDGASVRFNLTFRKAG